MSNMQKVAGGKLILIVGPSGSGKGTVIAELKKRHPEFVFPVSATTRVIRPGEKNDEVYHFISREEFEQATVRGDFLEYAEVHQNNYYGTLKKPILDALAAEKIIIREVDIQGFESIRRMIPKTISSDQLVSIFLVVSDLNELKLRILNRGKLPEEEIERRMESARREIAKSKECDYQIESPHGQIPRIVAEVEKIIFSFSLHHR